MSLHEPSGRSGLGLSLAATTMLLWGALPLGLKGALLYLDTVTLTAVRFVVAAAVLAAVLAPRRDLPTPKRFGRAAAVLLGIAVVGLTANFMGFIVGLDRTSPANAQLLIQLAPLLLGIGGIAVFGERYTRLQWIGVAVLVAGLSLFFQGQLTAMGDAQARYLSGTALLVFAGVTWAVYGLAQKQMLRSVPSLPLMCTIYTGCALALLPWTSPGDLGGLDTIGWLLVAFCAGNTLLAYSSFAMALEHLEASRVSAVLALTPIATLGFSAIAAWFWPDAAPMEALGASQWAGGCAVVVGSMTTTLGARRS